ncbi:deoxynucleoside triphosphate triphosphohydrolase SAMHD1 isoform X2 [Haplochromis burtoni]|nr:deoxynucleoside triphosphate triphosphohydrolase SAMHD1 isoform X2 [Haplochromis burtoni]
MFIPERRADLSDCRRKRQEISVKMFDHLLSTNNLHSSMKNYGLNVDGQNESDLVFIKEMIRGHLNTDETQDQFMGRTKDKYFLYEIVENEKNGIDVDKFDYIARDSYYLGIQSSFDHRRCLVFARVCRVDGINHICFRDKEVSNLYSMFQIRSLLHRTAYQHKTTRIIEVMIKDALLQAGECIRIEGSEGKIFSLSTAIGDMEAYTKLTDCVFEKILHSSERPDEMIRMLEQELKTDPSILFKDSSPSPTKENMETYKKMKKNIIEEAINSSSKEMGEAKTLLLKIVSRQIYKCLGKMKNPTMPEIDTWKQELARACPPGDNQKVTVTANDFEIVHFTMDYGITENELIENVFFYKKNQPDKPFNLREDEVSMLLPKCSSEQFIRVYYKNINEEVVETAQKHFDKWLSDKMEMQQ